MPASHSTQLDAHLSGDQEVAGLIPVRSSNSFVEIDHEILCMVMLSHLLIQEVQLSVSGKRKRVVRLTDQLSMTLTVLTGPLISKPATSRKVRCV